MSAGLDTRASGMQLDTLLGGMTSEPSASLPPIEVRGLCIDSRRVVAGDLFFARDGGNLHGLDFAEQAAAGGAVAVVARAAAMLARPQIVAALCDAGVPVISVGDADHAVGVAADRLFGAPSLGLGVAAVTGTNGKSTVAWLCATACRTLDDAPAGLLGTVGSGVLGCLSTASLTTADAIAVQATLAAVRDAGARHAIMEASSHALDQRRLAGTRLLAAAFTNLSRDHLDYHGTTGAYLAAKRRLFFDCVPAAAAFNVDDEAGHALATAFAPRGRAFACTLEDTAVPNGAIAVRGRVRASSADGLDIEITVDDAGSAGAAGATHVLRSPLIGQFNAANLLVTVGLLLALGYEADQAVAALATADAPPGRMQRSGGGSQPTVVVDYAHTPDALANALEALRPLTTGSLWCVFGCGGDRDKGKRPQMAHAAVAGADHVIMTDDNPRFESGDAIIDDALAGLESNTVTVERDRSSAISQAIAAAGPGDVVLVAGKGHEDYQDVAGEQRAFSDIDEVRRALADSTSAASGGARLSAVGGRSC